MRFDRESWRKLYVAESIEHRLLPIFCRGTRDYLIRHAKPDGTLLAKSEDPGNDLGRALGAHAEELELFSAFVKLLISDGYLSHKKGRLFITRFVEGQQSRSPGAVRQRRYRDKTRNVTEASPGDVTRDAPSDAHVTSQKTREEETRQEKKREEEEAPRPASSVRFPMHSAWRPGDETLAALDVGMIPRWAHMELLARFLSHFVANHSELSTDIEWNQRFSKWAFKDWGNSAKRPKKPEPGNENAEVLKWVE